METIESVTLACCALHNFLRNKSRPYIHNETLDRENYEDGTIEIGERCNPELVHNLQRRSGGQVLDQAKQVRDQFCVYFNGDGAVPWQEKSALNVD